MNPLLINAADGARWVSLHLVHHIKTRAGIDEAGTLELHMRDGTVIVLEGVDWRTLAVALLAHSVGRWGGRSYRLERG